MEARTHIFVTGRVQGVFFRDYTRRWAVSLGLRGWVRNLYDGRVEIVAEGERSSLNCLITKVREGPSHAQVDDLEVVWENHSGEFADFRVTY